MLCNRVLQPFKSERHLSEARLPVQSRPQAAAEEKAEVELMYRLVSREGKTQDTTAVLFKTVRWVVVQ